APELRRRADARGHDPGPHRRPDGRRGPACRADRSRRPAAGRRHVLRPRGTPLEACVDRPHGDLRRERLADRVLGPGRLARAPGLVPQALRVAAPSARGSRGHPVGFLVAGTVTVPSCAIRTACPPKSSSDRPAIMETAVPDGSYSGVPGPTSRSGITFAAASAPVEVNVTERSADTESEPEVESVLSPARFPRL